VPEYLFIERFSQYFYLANLVSGSIILRPRSSVETGLTFTYLWYSNKRRSVLFRIQEDAAIKLWGTKWSISAYIPGILWRFRKKNMFLKSGLEWYFAKGVALAEMWKYIEGEHIFIGNTVIVSKGTTLGGLIGVGVTHCISSNLEFEFSCLGRIAFVKSFTLHYSREFTITDYDFHFNFSGFYLQAGVNFIFLLRKEG
jgi:hypothetical protein